MSADIAVDPAAAPPADPADPQGSKPRDSARSWIFFAVTVALIIGSTTAMLLPLVPEAIGIAAIVLMLCMIFIRLPVALAMIVPALIGMYALRGELLVESALTTLPYSQVAEWSLSVVPMFILMGLLLWKAGLTESLYSAGRKWLGWMPGGLAVGTNIAGAGLASVSGSSVGTAYALARIGIPEMLKAGYDKRLAIGAVIVAGLPGQLIPPSIMLVIYAGIAEVPIGPQLLAGIGPGILVAILFTVMIVIFAKRWAPTVAEEAAGQDPVTWGDRFGSLAKIWPVPILIVVIVWGMFSGTFTATEAGACAALVSLLITFIWKRGDGPFRAIADASVATVSSVGGIFFMLIGVEMLSRMFTLTGISTGFAELVESMDLNRVTFLLLMMVVYIVLGTFMEPLPMMVLTIPILMPTLISLDISLLWYGAFAVLMGELAVVTPPVGILAFIIHQITKEPEVNQGQNIRLNDVFNACWWFMPMAILVTVILIFFPEISTWLPSMASDS
ncbi:TRAP transporter large permease [Nocardioides carbamazepini]|jgi:C4-dicarboxylate transporter DctM subunit|uniref:TRAP transporter large permease n=1 Tax=Nocardioides TaxID=1839 RepID=UPI002149F07A|nr:TRAP transporter large permease [Nocardioides carbamazepini]MCR1786270.1 TRAP transporter large permease [Nocardioides carbamazepini]MDQ6523410.1 TRAP transporter large permease [Nocardioides sp. LHD-245]